MLAILSFSFSATGSMNNDERSGKRLRRMCGNALKVITVIGFSLLFGTIVTLISPPGVLIMLPIAYSLVWAGTIFSWILAFSFSSVQMRGVGNPIGVTTVFAGTVLFVLGPPLPLVATYLFIAGFTVLIVDRVWSIVEHVHAGQEPYVEAVEVFAFIVLVIGAGIQPNNNNVATDLFLVGTYMKMSIGLTKLIFVFSGLSHEFVHPSGNLLGPQPNVKVVQPAQDAGKI
jgi:hypothetical protein